jgi:hypothetical protein
MVLLDQNFDAIAIYEVERSAVIAAFTAPGSRARNERGALDVRSFFTPYLYFLNLNIDAVGVV